MKKIVNVWLLSGMVLAGSTLVSCNSQADKDRKELANAEEEALEAAEKTTEQVATDSSKEEMSDAKEELLDANAKLNEKQAEYLKSLKEREKKIQERISKLDEKLKSAEGNSQKRLMEKKDKFTKERDLLQANILEMQKPMEDKRLETVQKEVQQRVVAIDKELSAED
jgi:DNA anti-recombination protein RmuC